MEMPCAYMDFMPNHILREILSYVSIKDICVCKRVCWRWRLLAKDPRLTRSIDLLPFEMRHMKQKHVIELMQEYFQDNLRILRVRGDCSISRRTTKSGLSQPILTTLTGRCSNLWWLHMEPGNVLHLSTPDHLPPSLTHLSLRWCLWPAGWLDSAPLNLPHLIYLDLSESYGVNDRDLVAVSQLTGLLTLKLDGCVGVSNHWMRYLVFHLPRLTYLSLQGWRTPDTLVAGMADVLPALEVLDLSRCMEVTSAGLSSMVSGLPSLKRLWLKECDHLPQDIYTVLRNSPSLTTVSLPLFLTAGPPLKVVQQYATVTECPSCFLTADPL